MYLTETRKTVLMVILVTCLLPETHEEVFTALADMETLVNFERELLSMLRVYVNFVETRTQEMYRFVSHLNRNTGYRNSNEDCRGCKALTSNPLGALSIIQRTVYKWSNIRQKLIEISGVAEEFKSYFKKKSATPQMPGIVDLYGAASAIFRLQSIYRLDARSILNGNIYLSSNNLLNFEDILELGKAAYFEKKMQRAKEWLDIVLERLKRNTEKFENTKSKQLFVEVREYLAVAEYELGHIQAAWNHTVEILKLEPKHERAVGNLDVIVNEMKEKGKQDESAIDPDGIGYNDDLYEGLCRGEKIVYPGLHDKVPTTYFSCGYKRDNPILLIKPVAYEVLSYDPEIIMFHNVIGGSDIDLVKKLAYPKLVRATVNNIKTGVSQIADYRISKSGWLSDKDHEVIEKISKRLEVVTGLASKTAEELQVANYGIGGHYDPHFDWARNFPISDLKAYGQGNRIATALLYMSDVEAGGGTAFLGPRVTVWPKKGSVAFWYNLYRNGTGKITTQHAACPVLLGSKWVANKWFHEYGQEFIRPCSLNRWE